MTEASSTTRTDFDSVPDRGDSSRERSPTHLSIGIAMLAGSAVAVTLGVYGSVHDPSGRSLTSVGFSRAVTMKNWLATAAMILLGAQVVMSLRKSGRLFTSRPLSSHLHDIQRLTGTVAFALTLPVVFHCLWSLGYRTHDLRIAVHSLTGCAAYGAYAARAVVQHVHRPGWLVPALGAVLGTVFVAAWWTSALWYFTNVSWGV